ncbi:MAG TPA: hypothetical protein VFN70_18020 [Burkholderiales bacterium]|nr:hypothetical protein [Burkholderiales bacterium]
MAEEQEEIVVEPLPSRIVYDVKCTLCPGDGVQRPARPGIDWPTPCPCKARKTLTNYQIGRIVDMSPRAIVRIDAVRAKPPVAERFLSKLHDLFPFWKRGS